MYPTFTTALLHPKKKKKKHGQVGGSVAEEPRAALLVEEPLHVGHPLAREAGVLGALGAGPARLALAGVLRDAGPVPAAVVDVEAGDLLNTQGEPHPQS